MDGYYGQNYEDWFLWQIFEGQKTGFFVDVGAFDGMHLSNTYSFELAGWTGLCVEAHPTYFEMLKANRPGSRCVHAACVADAGEGLVKFQADELGLFSGVAPDLTSTVHAYRWRGMQFAGFKEIEVPAVTLESLLDDTRIDFLSVDTEGTELDVLRGFDLEGRRPRVVIAEANTARAHRALTAYMENHGYTYALRAGVNRFYCAEMEDAHKLHKKPEIRPRQLAPFHPKTGRP